MVKVRNDLTGKRFGKLLVLNQTEDYISPSGRHGAKWLCKCDCGNIVERHSIVLKRGCDSCGCTTCERISRNNRKTNRYDMSGQYGVGYTSTNDEFYFDIEDYDKIKEFCWYKTTDGYIVAHCHENSDKRLYMHRVILGVNTYIDHINHIRHDNRRKNLRVASYVQNSQNRSMQSNNTSGTTGVYWNKRNKNWMAIIINNKNRIYLGSYSNIEDAIRVRHDAEIKYFGEYRRNDS